VHLCVFLKKWA